jgi:hypothetical protein
MLQSSAESQVMFWGERPKPTRRALTSVLDVAATRRPGPLRFPSAASSDQNRTCAFAQRDGACILDDAGKRVWRGKCASDPEAIAIAIGRHGEEGTHVGIARGHSVDLKPTLSRAFSHDGPALIDVLTNRLKLAMPPKTTLAVINGPSLGRTFRRSSAPKRRSHHAHGAYL